MRHRRSGLEELLLIARNLKESPGASVLEEFTSAELLAIGRAQLGGEWDLYPGEWSARQLREAIAGVVPRFRECEERRAFVPVHVDADGAEFDGHCVRCGEMNETERACTCPAVELAEASPASPAEASS